MALLDTTFLIDLMKEAKASRVGSASRKLEELLAQNETLRIAIFTVAELHVGIAKGSQPEREQRAIDECLKLFETLPFEESTAQIFGVVVGTLEKAGQTISDMDALIASVALEHGERLVTRNVRHFARISGLQVEGY
jgi:tRNA(fMet)-specific endonuclease VapC